MDSSLLTSSPQPETPRAPDHGAGQVVARLLLGAIGVVCIALGEYRIAFTDALTVRIDQFLGSWGRVIVTTLPPLYPDSVALGITIFAAGTVLFALALGALPASSERGRVETAVKLRWRESPWGARVWLAITVVLVLIAAPSLRQDHPKAGTVVVWAAMLMAGLATAVVLDRQRGTRLGNPFPDRWEGAVLALIVALDVILIAHDLTDWRWAGTPDESFFFMTAKALADGQSRYPLSEDGVFGYHPMLSSYYQVAFMKLFGADVFGWRLSSVAAVALSLPGLYLLARELWSRRAGYAAVLFFAPAQLAVAFAHHGYNNVQVYLIVLPALGLFAWAARRASLTGYYLAGSIAALGFFTFQPARFTPVLLLVLGAGIGAFSLRRSRRAPTIALIVGVLLTAAPILLRLRESVDHMLAQTALGGTKGAPVDQLVSAAQSWAWVAHLWDHWFVSLFYGVWSKTDHFVSNPVVDPVSAALAATGWWIAAASVRRQRGSRFLVPAWVLSVLVICATSPYPHPPLTRLLFLSPFTALFAGVALDQLMRRIAGTRDRARVAAAVGSVAVAAAVLWNVGATRHNRDDLNHGYGDGTTSELLRIVQGLPPSCRIVYIQRRETFMDNIDFVLSEYGMGDRLTYVRPFNQRALSVLEHLTPPAIVASDLRDADERARLEGIMSERFPERTWQDSDATQSWNVRYLYLPAPDA